MFKTVFIDGVRLYGRYAWPITRPLVSPVVYQLVGVGLWILLAYQSVLLLTHYFPHLSLWGLWSLFILANIPGILLFLYGFWAYLLWMAAINLLIRDLHDSAARLPYADYLLRVKHRENDYSILWLFLFAISCIPIPFLALPVFWLHAPPFTPFVWACVALFGAVGTAIAAFAMYTGTFIFQVFAFQPAAARKTWLRSSKLVLMFPWQSAFMGLVAIVAVQGVLPYLCLGLLDLLGITAWLSKTAVSPVQFIAGQTLDNLRLIATQEPLMMQAAQVLFSHPVALTAEIVKTLILTIAGALFLPLGACWLTLFYQRAQTTASL